MLTWRAYFELGFVEIYAEGVCAGRIAATHAELVSPGISRLWDDKTLTATIVGRQLGVPVSLCANSTKWYSPEPWR